MLTVNTCYLSKRSFKLTYYRGTFFSYNVHMSCCHYDVRLLFHQRVIIILNC